MITGGLEARGLEFGSEFGVSEFEGDVHRSQFAVRRSAFTVHRSEGAVRT